MRRVSLPRKADRICFSRATPSGPFFLKSGGDDNSAFGFCLRTIGDDCRHGGRRSYDDNKIDSFGNVRNFGVAGLPEEFFVAGIDGIDAAPVATLQQIADDGAADAALSLSRADYGDGSWLE